MTTAPSESVVEHLQAALDAPSEDRKDFHIRHAQQIAIRQFEAS